MPKADLKTKALSLLIEVFFNAHNWSNIRNNCLINIFEVCNQTFKLHQNVSFLSAFFITVKAPGDLRIWFNR